MGRGVGLGVEVGLGVLVATANVGLGVDCALTLVRSRLIWTMRSALILMRPVSPLNESTLIYFLNRKPWFGTNEIVTPVPCTYLLPSVGWGSRR